MSSELDNPHSLDDEPALRAIVEAVEAEIGERFSPSLVKHLATALGCAYAIATELLPVSPGKISVSSILPHDIR